MNFVRIVSEADLGSGELRAFDTLYDRICLANVAGSLFGFGDACTHGGCPLSEGMLTGSVLQCRCHGSEFDVTTGLVLLGPAEDPLQCYPVRSVSGQVEVDLDGGRS